MAFGKSILRCLRRLRLQPDIWSDIAFVLALLTIATIIGQSELGKRLAVGFVLAGNTID